MSMNKKISVFHLCLIAFAICINIVGGQIALALRLPIYLDSMGTFFIAAICGPVYGMIPNALSGVVMWMLGDIYALAYAPVGMILGFLTGLIWQKKKKGLAWLVFAAFVVTVPTSIVSAIITAKLFGGITSSGSSVIVQLLKKPLGLTMACFVVQLITDFVDRVIGLFLANALISNFPKSMLNKIH